MAVCDFFSTKRLLTHFVMCSFSFTYQIPSQPMMMYSKPLSGNLRISGFAVITCSYGGSLLLFLYYRSPRALDKFKFPLTLPSYTKPPAFLILLSSLGSYGLWSSLRATVFLETNATARESPELAQYIESWVMRTTLAVQPA